MADVKNPDAIDAMSKEEFFANVVCKVGKAMSLSRAVCLGVESLSPAEKNDLRKRMRESGIPEEDILTDSQLANAARKIASRAVNLR